MSRVEANTGLVKHFCEEASKTPSGTFEEMIAWHLGTMNSFLMDISVSLAVIADKMASPTGAERKDGEQE